MTTFHCPHCGGDLRMELFPASGESYGRKPVPEPAPSAPAVRRNFGVEPSHFLWRKMALKAVHAWLLAGGTNDDSDEPFTSTDLWMRYMDWATRRNLMWLTKRQLTSTVLQVKAFDRYEVPGDPDNRYKYNRVFGWDPEVYPGSRKMVANVPLFEPWMANQVDPWKFPWIVDAGMTIENVTEDELRSLQLSNFAAPDRWGDPPSVPSWRIRQPGWDPVPDFGRRG